LLPELPGAGVEGVPVLGVDEGAAPPLPRGEWLRAPGTGGRTELPCKFEGGADGARGKLRRACHRLGPKRHARLGAPPGSPGPQQKCLDRKFYPGKKTRMPTPTPGRPSTAFNHHRRAASDSYLAVAIPVTE